LIEPDDAEALSRALDEVLADEGLRDRMRDAGRRHAKQFTWARTANSLREAWSLAIEERSRHRG
jgi:D-inositol-3-phosphate glycosyltransferase